MEMTMTPTEALYHFTETRPKNVAFIKDKEIWTYERLATEVDRLARGLIEHGVRKGDRVALHMANLPELVVAYHACFTELGKHPVLRHRARLLRHHVYLPGQICSKLLFRIASTVKEASAPI
jgi:acyl-coenzyme A synthetase/AMP-(fatty) acid ligase